VDLCGPIIYGLLCVIATIVILRVRRIESYGAMILAVLVPIAGVIYALLVGRHRTTYVDAPGPERALNWRLCPHCDRRIRTEAVTCEHCGRDVPRVWH